MQLLIGEYRITSDDRCYVVEERKVAKEGKRAGEEYWSNARYPSTLLQACQMVLAADISKSEACELGQVIAAVERAERAVTEAVRQAALVSL